MLHLKSTIISNKCSDTIIIRSSSHVYRILYIAFLHTSAAFSTKDK